MNTDAWTLERAAFACFSGITEDSFKRLLLLSISSVVERNPNASSNKAFSLINDLMFVSRPDFEAAIRALETPFKRIRIDKYTPKPKPNPSAAERLNPASPRTVHHLNAVNGSTPWNIWVEAVTTKYPELTVWLDKRD